MDDKPKLLDQFWQQIRLKHYSIHAVPVHCEWPLLAGSSPSLPDGSNPSAAIVQSASDVQCSRLLKTTVTPDLLAMTCRICLSHNGMMQRP